MQSQISSSTFPATQSDEANSTAQQQISDEQQHLKQ